MMTSTPSALIIGASRGIGLGLVQQLSARGWQVAATCRGEIPSKSPSDVQWLTVDINHKDQRQALKSQLSAHKFDLIFINAGVYGPAHQDISQSSDEVLMALFMTNAFSPVRCAAELLPLIKSQTGVMALMTSQLASLNENGSATYPLYAASKAALNMLTRGLLDTAKTQNCTLLSVHPGWVQTDMGGQNATLTIEQSTQGIVEQIEAWSGKGGHHYVDYSGHTLQW
ncbi:SDR family oxidoreductase [Rouxiella badensis]|uniref:SDR family oxidoreductase n=1 Tax=Rouxiella badensis TaxID=1646377 RepID=UPI001B7A35E8|nr:SDR family oxidoreductase [Rouxiella badensis]MCC3703529.1 SDR family oxidoreductase [Rouxiella badensis]MCC3747424.1 SDR family oxidoreductase [Rouxiella badensis]